MKRYLGFGGIVSSAALVVISAQSAEAAATQITKVQVNRANGGVEVVLQTNNGERPQVFTVNRGNALVADIVNTELQLPEGKGFQQNNPAPGISGVSVAQLDANSVRVTVSGGSSSAPPSGQVNQGQRGIVLNVSSAGAASRAAAPAQTNVAQAPASRPAPAPSPPAPSPAPGRGQDVMVPNPEITINGVPAVQSGRTSGPPLLPRAIAPPLGDISVSNVETAPSEISLGTQELVPRLVLRDAPVRDVLSLLARAAGLNVAYVDASQTDAQGAAGNQQQAQPQQGQAGAATQENRVSLDIENEPVQNVFNYVLRIANLEANRVGRTVFVGPKLPDSARNLVTRTLRLNQATASDAANFLTTQGAETQISRERIEIQTLGEGAAARNVETRTPEILALRAAQGDAPLLLRGLSVATNTRLNTVTLVGSPRKVQMAEALISQLDLRQRQVAINVKVLDVNLLNTQDFSTSFSYGSGNFFGIIDRGAAVLNYGGTRPPSSTLLSDPGNPNLFTTPVIQNPYAEAAPFLSPTDRLNVPGGGGGIVQPNGSFTPTDATFLFPGRPLGSRGNPLNPGVTDFQQGDPTIITRDPNTGAITVTQGTQSTITSALPSLFQYPQRFLASLQAQIVAGNAKVLTDPTLVIQEGEQAQVNVGQEVVSRSTVTFTDTNSGSRETRNIEKVLAGLQLSVQVERVDDNGFVTVRINPTVSAPTGREDLGDGSFATLLSVRQLQSGRIRLRDSQTLIISGIIQDSDRTTVTKVPILGDIPILGALFRSTNRENSRQEVVALVTPSILDDSDFSNFGYRYTPGREVQEMLQRQGVQVP